MIKPMFKKLKWQNATLLGMLSMYHKDGGQDHLWACLVSITKTTDKNTSRHRHLASKKMANRNALGIAQFSPKFKPKLRKGSFKVLLT
jgi:hypothetical protein